MEGLGFVSVLPLIALLILVCVTKKIIPSMVFILIIIFILKDGFNFITGATDSFYNVVDQGTFIWLMLVLALFGGLIEIFIDSRAVNGFGGVASKHIKSQKSSLIFTWFLGVALFVDDYINNLAIGPAVRKITDKYNVPREAIGFIVIAMGVPIIALVPITAVSVFMFGVMQEVGMVGADANMITEVLKMNKYLFYPMVIIVVALLFALGVLPKLGAMKKAYERDAQGPKLDVVESVDESSQQQRKNGTVLDFILPMVAVVVVMAYTSTLEIAAIVGLLVAFVMYIFRKLMTVDEFFMSFLKGVNSMTETIVVVLFAFMIGDGLKQIGMNEYLIEVGTTYLHGSVIPLLAFLLLAIITYLGIEYFAATLLMAPIIIPLALEFSLDPYFVLAAILSGGVAGATNCFYGEQMLMCSQSVQKKPFDMGICCLPYGIIATVITAIIYGIVGFTM